MWHVLIQSLIHVAVLGLQLTHTYAFSHIYLHHCIDADSGEENRNTELVIPHTNGLCSHGTGAAHVSMERLPQGGNGSILATDREKGLPGTSDKLRIF